MAPLTRMRNVDHVPSSLAVQYYGQRATKGGLIIAEGMVRHSAPGPALAQCLKPSGIARELRALWPAGSDSDGGLIPAHASHVDPGACECLDAVDAS